MMLIDVDDDDHNKDYCTYHSHDHSGNADLGNDENGAYRLATHPNFP